MKSVGLLSLAVLAAFSRAEKLTLPAQLGPYPVSISEYEVRTNRSDILAPSPELRRLMVTVYRPNMDILACPVQNQVNIPYIPDAVAEAFEKYETGALIPAAAWQALQLVNCDRGNGTGSSCEAPIVLFSHGLQSSRYIHATSLGAVASSGYTVVAIDHTYDAVSVVFPDGTIAPTQVSTDCAYAGNQTCDDLVYGDSLQPIRIADAYSVLDAIESGQLPGFANHPTPLKTAMYGHSAGGSTSAGAVANDSRIISAMNVDGSFTGFVRNLTITKPFVMLGEEVAVPNWDGYYATGLKGMKAKISVNNTVHVSFTDAPLVVDALGLRKNLTAAQTAAFVGTIDSRRNQEIGWRLTVEWLDYVFKGKTPLILTGERSQFPDVSLVYAEGSKR